MSSLTQWLDKEELTLFLLDVSVGAAEELLVKSIDSNTCKTHQKVVSGSELLLCKAK